MFMALSISYLMGAFSNARDRLIFKCKASTGVVSLVGGFCVFRASRITNIHHYAVNPSLAVWTG
jgi:hypothetical protein